MIDPEDPSLGTEFVTSDTNFWSNASSRNIDGFEVSGYFNFENLLPEWDILDGLSFVPNYAYITGDQTDPIFDQDELAEGNFVLSVFMHGIWISTSNCEQNASANSVE